MCTLDVIGLFLLGGLVVLLVVVCACRVSGDADEVADELEQYIKKGG